MHVFRRLTAAALTPVICFSPAHAQTAPTAVEPAIVNDGLVVNDYLFDAPVHTTGEGAAEGRGAFRFVCSGGHLNADDPVVYPGIKGGSPHEHQWFGNKDGGNFAATYQSMRTSNASGVLNSCFGNPLNKSDYWQPAMLNGKGKVVAVDEVTVYYKRVPRSSPRCTQGPVAGVNYCIQLPRGLRFIFGYDLVTNRFASGALEFDCQAVSGGQPGATPGKYANLVEAATKCPIGNQIKVAIAAPGCWSGKDLDSPNHRDHVADWKDYGSGEATCPPSHPWIIPQFELGSFYTVDADLDRSGDVNVEQTWHLSSDRMYGKPRRPGGTTWHSDWFGAWNDEVLKAWTDNCIDRLLSCAAGDLGNGKVMRVITSYPRIANPHLLAKPPLRRAPFQVHVHGPQ